MRVQGKVNAGPTPTPTPTRRSVPYLAPWGTRGLKFHAGFSPPLARSAAGSSGGLESEGNRGCWGRLGKK